MPNISEAAEDFNPYTPESAIEGPAAPEEPQPSTERPRGPDGRFLKSDDAPTPPAISPALRREAKQLLGLDDSDLATMSPADVKTEVRFHKLAARMDRQSDAGRPAQAAPSVSSDFAPLSADQTDYEALVARVNDLTEQMRSFQAAAQHVPKLAKYLQDQEDRQRLTLARRFDRFFARHPETYGPGTFKDVDPQGPDFYFRQAMAQAALAETGGEAEGLEEVLERLHAQRTGRGAPPRPKAQQPSRVPEYDDDDDETDRLYANGSGVLGRPTQRSTPPLPPGPERARQEVGAILANANARTARRGSSIIPGTLDGLPE